MPFPAWGFRYNSVYLKRKMMQVVETLFPRIIIHKPQEVSNRNLVHSQDSKGELLRNAYAMFCHSVVLRFLL